MDFEESVEEKLIFLDFQGNVPNDLFKNKVFIRLANLEDEKPLIQVNDLIFEGSYDDSVGTNLFFQKVPNDDPPEFPFKDRISTKLQFISTTTKIMNCKKMKVDVPKVQLPASREDIKFNLKWDYKELLRKLEDGTLDLQDMMVSETRDTPEQADPLLVQDLSMEEVKEEPSHFPVVEKTKSPPVIMEVEKPSDKGSSDKLNDAYNNLLLLARTPVRRDIENEDCPCDPKYKDEFEYKNIECKVLARPLFSYTKTKRTHLNSINLERCILMGLIWGVLDDSQRNLTDEEKSAVMTVENLENLDLTARYSVLQAHKEALEKEVCENTKEQNSVKDEFNRTPIETLDIFKRLLAALSRRIEEIRLA